MTFCVPASLKIAGVGCKHGEGLCGGVRQVVSLVIRLVPLNLDFHFLSLLVLTQLRIQTKR